MEFPTQYTILKDGYSVELQDGTETDRADSGRLWVRRLYAEDRFDIVFRVGPVDATQVLELQAFYQSFRHEQIEWADPYTGQMYQGLMIAPPRQVSLSGIMAAVEFTMEGLAQNGG